MPTQNQFNRQSLISLLDRILDVLTVAAAAIPLFFSDVPDFFARKNRRYARTPKSRSSAAWT